MLNHGIRCTYVALVKKNVASDKHNKHKENKFVCFPYVVAVLIEASLRKTALCQAQITLPRNTFTGSK